MPMRGKLRCEKLQRRTSTQVIHRPDQPVHTLSTVPKRNEDLQVGDVVVLWWGEAKPIVRIEPHELWPRRGPFAIAYFDDGFGLTLYRRRKTDVVQEGAA